MRLAGVVTLRGPPSAIPSLALLIVLISRIPQIKLRVPINALGFCYISCTVFRIGEFVAKILNSSERLTNCKN